MTQKNAKITIIFIILALILVACSSTADPVVDESGETDTEIIADDGGLPENASGSRGHGDGEVTAPETTTKAEPTRAVSEATSGWVDGSPADSEADSSETIIVSGDAIEITRSTTEVIVEEGEAVEVTRVTTEAIVETADSDDSMLAFSEPVSEGDSAPPAEPRASSVDTSVAQNSALTAGGVDDNENWDDYLLYLRDYSGARVLEVDVSERHQIRVVDNAGNPILAALITIEANDQEVATLRTHSNGLAYFFPQALLEQNRADTYTMRVNVADTIEEFVIEDGGSQRVWDVTHPAGDQLPRTVRLDVQFLIDATGSMSDEIAQLKENIRAISAQINALPSQPDVRFAMTVYRDQGDDYVSRTFDFTPNVEDFAAALADVEADGGGDYPEDLNEGLSRAIHVPEWRVEETVSLIFLVADAPPHLDYGQENHYAAELVEASKRGIKIYPIASSGLDEQGEYIFRQLAQYTGGEFLFLTYGAGGAGTTGTETTHEVEDYSVSSLDELVVQIVEEELAFR